MMVRSPGQIIKSVSPLYLPSFVKAYDIYSKICILRTIHSGNMHNESITLNVRMHAGQMLNILSNGTPTVSNSTIAELSVYTGNSFNLNASVTHWHTKRCDSWWRLDRVSNEYNIVPYFKNEKCSWK